MKQILKTQHENLKQKHYSNKYKSKNKFHNFQFIISYLIYLEIF